MSPIIGIILSLFTAGAKSTSEIISKFGLNQDMNPIVMALSLRIFAIPFLLIAVLLSGVPTIEINELIPTLAVSGTISVVGTILYMYAIKYSDISIVSPLGSITPLALLVTSPIILGEFPSRFGLFGVLFVTGGVYILRLDKKSTGLIEPITSIKDDKGARYMLGLVALYSISSNVDKIAVEASGPIFYSFILHIYASTFLFIISVFVVEDWQSSIRNNWKTMIPVGVFSGLSSILQMIALTYTLVIYVIAVKRTGIVFSVLSGHFIFNEENIRERILGTIIILVGVMIITLSL